MKTSAVSPQHVAAAEEALERLRPQVSAATLAVIEKRLAGWQQQANEPVRPVIAQPELVVRPGLPPRPLPQHYFTVVRTL